MALWCHFTCHRIPPSPCIVPASLKDLHQIYVNISNCEMKSKLPQFSYNVKWTLYTWTVWQLISPGCSFFGLHSSFSSFWILQSPVKKGKYVPTPLLSHWIISSSTQISLVEDGKDWKSISFLFFRISDCFVLKSETCSPLPLSFSQQPQPVIFSSPPVIKLILVEATTWWSVDHSLGPAKGNFDSTRLQIALSVDVIKPIVLKPWTTSRDFYRPKTILLTLEFSLIISALTHQYPALDLFTHTKHIYLLFCHN